MEVSQALNQLAEIQDKLARSQVYRGYRPLTVAATSLCALVAGAVSLHFPPQLVWPAMAACCIALGGGEMAYDYWANFSNHQKRLARNVLLQFLPSLTLGGLWTWIWLYSGHSPALLPAIWAMCYGSCLLSSRPYLPQGVGYVGAYYGLAALAMTSPLSAAHFNLAMTLCFALGQLTLALILHWNQPRRET